MITLRKLAKQQENQYSLKFKNRILKKTHDIKIAESLSPITKTSDELNESTLKVGEIATESNTPRLAIENTHNTLPLEKEQTHPGVIIDTSLENTTSNMKDKTGFFTIEEKNNGDSIWNGLSVDKKGDNKLKIIEKVYKITPRIQKVLTDTSSLPLEKLNDKDNETFIKILESLVFQNYKAMRDESKSSTCKYSKTN